MWKWQSRDAEFFSLKTNTTSSHWLLSLPSQLSLSLCPWLLLFKMKCWHRWVAIIISLYRYFEWQTIDPPVRCQACGRRKHCSDSTTMIMEKGWLNCDIILWKTQSVPFSLEYCHENDFCPHHAPCLISLKAMLPVPRSFSFCQWNKPTRTATHHASTHSSQRKGCKRRTSEHYACARYPACQPGRDPISLHI